MERLLQYCSKETDYEQQEVENIIGCFLDKISQELSEGHTVDLGSCFGIFSVKLRTGALCNIPPEQFSLWEWQDAVAYITEESLSFESPEQAADYLKNYRVRQETGGSYET